MAEGIKSAKADGVVTHDEARGLLVLCEEYLLLNPQGVKVQTIADQCRSKFGKPIVNSIGIELNCIEPGTFMMGKGKSAVAVTLTKLFWLGKTEVTQGQFKKVMGTEPWKGGESPYVRVWGININTQDYVQADKDCPATYVDWNDATAFCQKLTDLERKAGKLQAGESYRLPTEAEWEYACRAGTTTEYSFGDDEEQLGEYAWFKGNALDVGEQYAHKVGLKKPNPWGLHDMHGNVWEWCSDWYAGKLSGGIDPAAVAIFLASARVIRGGGWGAPRGGCRSANRGGNDPSFRSNGLGFRVARSQSVQ